MSQFMSKRAVVYNVKVGSRDKVTVNIKDSNNVTINLSDTGIYASGKLKVWKPDITTLIINGTIVFADRVNGKVTYVLSATDTVVANAGNWEGEVELKDSAGDISLQTETFSFIIEVSG